MPTFIVERPPGPSWDHELDTREQPLWDEHALFMDGLFERGAVVLAGPVAGAADAVLVLEAGSAAEVRELLAPDPWCVNGIMGIGRVREWRVFLDARRLPSPAPGARPSER